MDPTVLVSSSGSHDIGAMIRPFLGKIRFIQGNGAPVRGCFIVPESERVGVSAELGDKRSLSAPFIDVEKLSGEEVVKELLKLLSEDEQTPSLKELVFSFSGDMVKWARAKFARATPEEIEERLSMCHACELWDPQGFHGTGRCRKCGCSTWAKIRLKTSSCPISKWGSLDVENNTENK